MTFLLLLAVLIAVLVGTLIVFKYRQIFPYAMVTFVGVFYLSSEGISIKLGSINVYGSDLFIAFAIVNIFFRLLHDAEPLSKNARMLIFGFLAYVVWLQLSEIVHFYSYEPSRRLDNLIRITTVNLYPLVAVSIVLSLSIHQFRLFFGYIAFIAACVSVGLIFKEVFDIGGHVTSSGSIRRGAGEVTVLLHIGLGYALFRKNLGFVIRVVCVLLILSGIALLSHRSSFLGTGLLLAIYFIYTLRYQLNKEKAILAVPAVAFASVAIVLFVSFSNLSAVESFRNRLSETTNLENKTSVGRLQKWTVAMKSVVENPIGGTKLNGLDDFYGDYLLEADFGRFTTADAHGAFLFLLEPDPWPPHNMFVNILSRNGVVALAFFLLAIFGAILVLKKRDARSKYCGTAILFANIVYLTFNNHYKFAVATTLAICLFAIPLRISLDEDKKDE